MNKHLEEAVRVARIASKGGQFEYLMLHGSVAEGKARPTSDIDILMIRENIDYDEPYFKLMEKLIQYERKSKFELDLDEMSKACFEREDYLETIMFDLEHPNHYITVFQKGILFDGSYFTKKAIEVPFFQECSERMKRILKARRSCNELNLSL